MQLKDRRLNTSSEIINSNRKRCYNSLFENNEYTGFRTLLNWLNEQLKLKINGRLDGATSFEQALQQCKFENKILDNGDMFYTQLFDEGNWIPAEVENEERLSNPFTYTVRKTFNDIWQLSNELKSSRLMIYYEFERYLKTVLGELVGKDNTYAANQTWREVPEVLSRSYEFYSSWVTNFDVQAIRNQLEQLLNIPEDAKIHELASLMDYRNDKKGFTEQYENELKSLQNESDWKFVDKATSTSDYTMLNEELRLNEDLILRTEIKNWVLWVDNLKWLILQDSAFFNIKDLSAYETIIGHIVDQSIELKSNRIHLLLLTLKNFYETVEKITINLSELQKDWHHGNTEEKQAIQDEALIQHKSWKNSEMKGTIQTVFDTVFNQSTISNSVYFKAVFEWFCSYSATHYENENTNDESRKLTFNTFKSIFQEKINQDKGNKLSIIGSLTTEKLQWSVFDMLIGILEADESDSAYQEALYLKYKDYFDSDGFKWNLGLNFSNTFINQAYKFSYLLKLKYANPFETWQELYLQHQCQHEGWNFSYNGHEKLKREAYMLTVGACLAYVLFEKNKSESAQIHFDYVLNQSLAQHRSDLHTSEDYRLPLKLLAVVVAKFNHSIIDDFNQRLCVEIDDECCFLHIMHRFVKELKMEQQTFRETSIHLISERIESRFWIVENKYNHVRLKYEKQAYQIRKEEIMDFVTNISQ